MICEVFEKTVHPDFRAMPKIEGLENMQPGINILDADVKIYENIRGYEERCQR